MQIDSDKKIKVRVGRTFMNIEEFIDKFTDSDSKKEERKEVLARFQSKLFEKKISIGEEPKKKEYKPVRKNWQNY